MKIAIAVQGRFHAFDLAKALLSRGHDVRVFTNYPHWATRRFGLRSESVHPFPVHGVLSRALGHAPSSLAHRWEPIGHSLFGRWAARMLSRERWDVIHCWSGISEEILQSAAASHALTVLMRGSSHIAVQRRLLDEESRRAATALDTPSDWMVARETREYALADRITVLSTFAYRSFIDAGVSAEKLTVLPLGVDVDPFRAPSTVVDARRRRVRDGAPLRVLYVGAVSYRKGFLDLASVIDRLGGKGFEFTVAGPVLPETSSDVARVRDKARFIGKVPQSDLPHVYWDADLLAFPTIEDGFAVVLAQAKAAGLPIVTTANSAGADLVRTGVDGWIVPIRRPDAVIAQLEWCRSHREEFAGMIGRVAQATSRGWDQVAADFEHMCATPAAAAKERQARVC